MALMSPYSDGINELKLLNLVEAGRKSYVAKVILLQLLKFRFRKKLHLKRDIAKGKHVI